MLLSPRLGIRDQQDSTLEVPDGGAGMCYGVTGVVGPTAASQQWAKYNCCGIPSSLQAGDPCSVCG